MSLEAPQSVTQAPFTGARWLLVSSCPAPGLRAADDAQAADEDLAAHSRDLGAARAPALLNGRAWGHLVKEPLLFDPVIYTRFLFVVPLLEFAQVVVESSLGVQMRQFLKSGLIPEKDQPVFLEAQATAVRLRGSVAMEVVIAVLALVLSICARVIVSPGPHSSTWERVGNSITPAGWWYVLVSLPILGFFLLRWFWVFGLWAWFLFRVSRLDLELTPTHPDRAGGWDFSVGDWRASRSF